MVRIKLKDFQLECVDKLMNEMTLGDKKNVIIDSPTGSGKTVILLDFIDDYLKEYRNTIFIWLTPGAGELEEQSQEKMIKFLPHRQVKTIKEVLLEGFEENDTAFINWETVTKKGNNALKETERKNLLERIQEAHNEGYNFVVIVDEEHRNDTDKANALINEFNPIKIVRVSATPKKKDEVNIISINEIDVINSGLITRALYINENVEDNVIVNNEIKYLLDLAITKRLQIVKECEINKTKYNPLVIIQFPSMSEIIIKQVEKYLSEKGYTYENCKIAKWMSENKQNIESICENNSCVDFLLFKQAINVGWDCPRAKILVKLRENMNEDFEIQTIGRIRRMPEAHHYDNIILDNCYLYTFDEEYKTAVKQGYKDASEAKIVFLKKEYTDFRLTKEFKDNQSDLYGNRESAKVIYEFFKEKYKLTNKKTDNKKIFENNGFSFNTNIVSNIAKGVEVELEKMSLEKIKIQKRVSTHENGIDMKHAVGVISSKAGMKYDVGKQILQRLFRFNIQSINLKLLNLSNKDFYAFVINNQEKLKDDISEAVAKPNEQMNIKINNIRREIFSLPEMDYIKYDPKVKIQKVYNKNVYDNYPSSAIRSICERKFEKYCESDEKIKWWYKNGESAQNYFSLIYVDLLNKSHSFYPDYILLDKEDHIWIIEAKGGEDNDGKSKNIDMKAQNKYTVLRKYCINNDIKFGFVRDREDEIFISQAEQFIENMQDDSWQEISTIL